MTGMAQAAIASGVFLGIFTIVLFLASMINLCAARIDDARRTLIAFFVVYLCANIGLTIWHIYLIVSPQVK